MGQNGHLRGMLLGKRDNIAEKGMCYPLAPNFTKHFLLSQTILRNL